MPEVREAPDIKTMEATIKEFPQLANLLKGADIRDFRSYDTGTYKLPGLELFTTAQPVDSIITSKGREFQFDKYGNTTYKITHKDSPGLYDITRDYLTARDGRTPTPDQIRRTAQQVAKESGVKDINHIGVGTTLKFPGPEHARMGPGINPQSINRPTEATPRYPAEERNAPGYPTRAEYAPNRKHEDPKGVPILRNKDDQKIDNGDGSFTRVWKGQVEDAGIFDKRTKTQGWEKTDRFGNLIQSEIHFDKPKSIEIPKDRNSSQNVDARKIEKQFDTKDGMTYTKVTTETGDVLVYRTNANGQSERYDIKTGRWK